MTRAIEVVGVLDASDGPRTTVVTVDAGPGTSSGLTVVVVVARVVVVRVITGAGASAASVVVVARLVGTERGAIVVVLDDALGEVVVEVVVDEAVDDDDEEDDVEDVVLDVDALDDEEDDDDDEDGWAELVLVKDHAVAMHATRSIAPFAIAFRLRARTRSTLAVNKR
jgi:hypothetical protein